VPSRFSLVLNLSKDAGMVLQRRMNAAAATAGPTEANLGTGYWQSKSPLSTERPYLLSERKRKGAAIPRMAVMRSKGVSLVPSTLRHGAGNRGWSRALNCGAALGLRIAALD
jgi:hypothetical protein